MKPLRSVWILMFLVMFCCCSGSLTTWFVAKRTAQRALAEKLDKLQARGIPVDDQSMTEFHAKLNSEEIATELVRLLDHIVSPGFNDDCAGLPIVSNQNPPIPPLSQTWTEQSSVEAMLAKHAEKISRIIELTQNNGPVRYPIKFNAASTLLTNTQNTRSVVRVLCLEAEVAARKGDAEREFRAYNAMLGCSIALNGEPTLISQLVNIACCGIATNQIKSAVQSNRLKPEHYEKLRERLIELSNIGKMYRTALVGELGLMTVAMTDPKMLREQIGPMASLVTESGLAERAALRHAEYLERLMELNTDDLRDFREQIRQIDEGMAGKASTFNIQERITQQFTPAISAFSDALVRHKMSTDIAILALATRQYEHKHAGLPKTLNELSDVGMELEKFKAVDGSVPLYQLTSPDQQEKFKSRAVIWSFDNRKVQQISNTMPELFDIEQVKDDGAFWWHWDLK